MNSSCHNYRIFVGVPEVYPTILVVGALGQCGRGSLDIAKKIGIPE